MENTTHFPHWLQSSWMHARVQVPVLFMSGMVGGAFGTIATSQLYKKLGTSPLSISTIVRSSVFTGSKFALFEGLLCTCRFQHEMRFTDIAVTLAAGLAAGSIAQLIVELPQLVSRTSKPNLASIARASHVEALKFSTCIFTKNLFTTHYNLDPINLPPWVSYACGLAAGSTDSLRLILTSGLRSQPISTKLLAVTATATSVTFGTFDQARYWMLRN